MWKWTKRIVLGLICLVASLLLAGISYQFISTKLDERAYPPPGQLVDIGGYRLHMNCSGEGSPTVVFDSGLGGNSLCWALIQPEVSKFAKVITYDRAGYGWSDKSPLERTSENIIEELHSLLKEANIPGPYVLVGHSFGGPNVLLYANKYPEEVAAIVLVDSAHEDQEEKLSFLTSLSFLKCLKYATYVGGTRALVSLPQYEKHIKEGLKLFSFEFQKIIISTLLTDKFIETMVQEDSLFDVSLKQLKAINSNIGDKPLIVITGGKKMNPGEWGLSQEQIDSFEDIWPMLQKELTTRSTKSKHLIAEHSGHMVPWEQPEIIIEAIQEIVLNKEPVYAK